jgi:hypothetical protein
MNLDRGQVWKQLGAPTDQEGSVNDPRSSEEYGVKWNEKWIYRGEDGKSIERVVLWDRYDLVGAFRIQSDGSAEPETLSEK